MEYVGIVRPTVAFHKQKAEKKNIPSRYITIYHILLISHLSLTVSTSVKCETIGRHPITFLDYILGGVTPTKALFSTFIL